MCRAHTIPDTSVSYWIRRDKYLRLIVATWISTCCLPESPQFVSETTVYKWWTDYGYGAPWGWWRSSSTWVDSDSDSDSDAEDHTVDSVINRTCDTPSPVITPWVLGSTTHQSHPISTSLRTHTLWKPMTFGVHGEVWVMTESTVMCARVQVQLDVSRRFPSQCQSDFLGCLAFICIVSGSTHHRSGCSCCTDSLSRRTTTFPSNSTPTALSFALQDIPRIHIIHSAHSALAGLTHRLHPLVAEGQLSRGFTFSRH